MHNFFLNDFQLLKCGMFPLLFCCVSYYLQLEARLLLLPKVMKDMVVTWYKGEVNKVGNL